MLIIFCLSPEIILPMFMRHQALLNLDTIRPNKKEDDTLEEEKCLIRKLIND